MANNGSESTTSAVEIENQANLVADHEENEVTVRISGDHDDHVQVTIVVCGGQSQVVDEQVGEGPGHLSRNSSTQEQCRICQQEKKEALIDLGCLCRGELSKVHQSCINAWFRTRRSNKCEICQVVAANVPPPVVQASSVVAVPIEGERDGATLQGTVNAQEHEGYRSCPLWTAISILVGGLFLDVVITIVFGHSTMPINIIVGFFIVFGLGTVAHLVLDVGYKWYLRRAAQRVVMS